MNLDKFSIGDQKQLRFKVESKDTATFETGQVHPFYATFALGRDAEWTCRQFALEIKEMDEEGIGTYLTIHHQSPALLGSEVQITAKIKAIQNHEIICHWEAYCGERLIAIGEQGQKILKKEKIERLMQKLG